jgi:hypothetical protein
LVQVAALLYGMNTVFSTRPVFMVYTEGRFDLVYANDLDAERLGKANPQYQTLPLMGISTVGTHRTDNDARIRNKIPYGLPAAMADLPLHPQFYLPYAEVKANVAKALLPVSDLTKFNPDDTEAVARVVEQYGNPAEFGYLPLVGSLKSMSVIINKATRDVVEIRLFMPWKSL